MRGEEAAMAVVGRNHFFRVGWYKFKHFKIKELKDAFEMPLLVCFTEHSTARYYA